jgi:hypothetical protein
MKSVVAACVLLCLALGVSAQARGQWISGTASHTNGPEVSEMRSLRRFDTGLHHWDTIGSWQKGNSFCP